MKRVASFLLLLFLPHGFSQSTATKPFTAAPSPETAASCPLEIVKASFDRSGRVMLAAEGGQSSPSLRLQLDNPGTKLLKTVDVTVRARYKPSRYQLDSTSRDIPLTLSRDIGPGFGKSNVLLQLPDGVLTIDWVLVNRISYRDGSSWMSHVVPPSTSSPEVMVFRGSDFRGSRSNCGFWSNSPSNLLAAR